MEDLPLAFTDNGLIVERAGLEKLGQRDLESFC
jgi:hypothetical protein